MKDADIRPLHASPFAGAKPAAQLADVVGWYGKLPSLGDFASRRMDPDFIEAWDGWLSTGLAEWQVTEAATWREQYRAGPSWRFVLMTGVLSSRPPAARLWAGVLAPSVDQVGRCFPLTLVQPLACLPTVGAQTESLSAWLHRLDDLAVDALQERWSVEQLESALQRQGTWSADDTAASNAAHFYQDRQALWLRGDAQGCPRLHITDGLPRGQEFIDLLAGACGA